MEVDVVVNFLLLIFLCVLIRVIVRVMFLVL